MATDRFPMFLQASHDVTLLEIVVRPAEAPPGRRALTLAISGEIDPLTAGSLHQALMSAIREHRADEIGLDLTEVIHLDSAGVRTLLSGLVTAERADCGLRITAASPIVCQVLHVCGVLEAFGLPPARDKDRAQAGAR